MGNMLSVHEKANSATVSKVSTNANSNRILSHTALGQFSVKLPRPSSTDGILHLDKNVSIPMVDSSKIYKEIFPPPKSAYTLNSPTSVVRRTQSLEQLTAIERNIEEIDELPKYCNTDDFTFDESDAVNNIDVEDHVDPLSERNDYELNWVKSGEDIRRSYIAKLIYKQVWQPTVKEKNHNTLIIFDWDDTLLCTSFLTPNGAFSDDMKISEKDIEVIKRLDSCSSAIINLATSKGETYIITNAAPGWVEYSAKRFYPEVAKILNKVNIVSARGAFEKKFPGDNRQWKILAYLEVLKKLNTNLVTNLICLGDSVIEMEAAHILASKFSQAFIKTIKFRESPKPEELLKQLNLIQDQFEKIFSAVKNLTIRVERKGKERNSITK